MSAFLVGRGLRRDFDGEGALRGVDLDVEAGSLHALLGESGCGKTTLLRIIAGFERADAGTVEIEGERLAGDGVHVPPERRRLGMVFQQGALFPHLDVGANVAFGLRDADDAEAVTARLLELVGLAGFERRAVGALSGGERQRVALARALAPEPRGLLLDEPFSGLDAPLRAGMRRAVREVLRQVGTTAVLVTHDRAEAFSLADRVSVMMDGTLVQTGRPEELYARPVSPRVAAFTGAASFLPGTADGAVAATPCGPVPLLAPATGPVTVLLRPEQVIVGPAEHGNGIPVAAREFHGDHVLLELRPEGAEPLQARAVPGGAAAGCDRVTVRVDDPAVAWPGIHASSGSMV